MSNPLRTFRLIWGQVPGLSLAASGITKGQGKSATGTLLAARLLSAAVAQAAPTPEPVPADAGSSGVNAITQAAVQKGALTCASRINQVSNFLGFGPQAGASAPHIKSIHGMGYQLCIPLIVNKFFKEASS